MPIVQIENYTIRLIALTRRSKRYIPKITFTFQHMLRLRDYVFIRQLNIGNILKTNINTRIDRSCVHPGIRQHIKSYESNNCCKSAADQKHFHGVNSIFSRLSQG